MEGSQFFDRVRDPGMTGEEEAVLAYEEEPASLKVVALVEGLEEFAKQFRSHNYEKISDFGTLIDELAQVLQDKEVRKDLQVFENFLDNLAENLDNVLAQIEAESGVGSKNDTEEVRLARQKTLKLIRTILFDRWEK